MTLETEPASLSAEDEASKYLALAAYARLKGDTQGAGSALDTLIAHQPSILEASKEKADLLAAQGDYAGALSLYELTLSNFLAANPNASEPLTLLTRPIDAMVAKIAQQQAGPGTTVTSVAPGRTEPVIAPDSIVDAYGAGLATANGVRLQLALQQPGGNQRDDHRFRRRLRRGTAFLRLAQPGELRRSRLARAGRRHRDSESGRRHGHHRIQ